MKKKNTFKLSKVPAFRVLLIWYSVFFTVLLAMYFFIDRYEPVDVVPLEVTPDYRGLFYADIRPEMRYNGKVNISTLSCEEIIFSIKLESYQPVIDCIPPEGNFSLIICNRPPEQRIKEAYHKEAVDRCLEEYIYLVNPPIEHRSWGAQ